MTTVYMSLKGFERFCDGLTLRQLRLLGTLSRGAPVKGTNPTLKALCEAGLVDAARGGFVVNDNGRAVIRGAVVRAEHEAGRALADANEERERGRDATRCDARAQRWLDIANDLRGQGSRGP